MKPVSFSLGLLLCVAFIAANASAASKRPPNIIIIFADDLGYGDLGCYGHPSIRTPHLDRMAAEGMRFTDFYVAANVCTPSRAALLTGRLPVRNGMAGDMKARVLFPDSTKGLPASELTIAEALKPRGYATACIGKWHLGHLPEFLPANHGFDEYFGIPYSNDMAADPKRRVNSIDPNARTDWWHVPLLRGTHVIEQPADQTTLTKRYTEEAVRFIRENRKRPFFLYLPHTFPHIPLFASEKFRGSSRRGLYGDVVEELDWSVGRILEVLRRERLADNTFVFFTSDNGPWITKGFHGGSAGLLRDGKGGCFEGGMRVPGIAWWPGRIKAGVVTGEQANAMDLFNTCLSLAGVPLPADRMIDGVDLSPLLLRNEGSGRDTQFYYCGDELFAIRKGPYKAHFVTWVAYSREAPQRHETPLLYHLQHDPGEQFNIAAAHPEIVAEMTALRDRHLSALVRGTPQVDRGTR